MDIAHRAEYVRTSSRRVTVSIQTSDTLLVRANANRIAITFSCPVSNRVTLAFNETAQADAGVILYPTNNPVTFTLDMHGDAVRGEWRGIADTAAEPITVVETTLIH